MRKEKVDYVGAAPLDVYVVWVEGSYRIYTSISYANRWYLAAKEKGKKAKLIRYAEKELMAK